MHFQTQSVSTVLILIIYLFIEIFGTVAQSSPCDHSQEYLVVSSDCCDFYLHFPN